MPISVQDRIMLQHAYSVTEQSLRREGYNVRVATDFVEIRDEIECAGKELTPFFWTNYFDFNHRNGFCLVLESNGKGLAYLCTQMIDCGDMNFQQKYVQRLQAIYSHDKDAELDTDWVCTPLQDIKGVVAYSGDAVTHRDLRVGGKSLELLGALSRLSLYFTLMHWVDTGWIVGTVRQKDLQRGLGWYYGATRTYPMVEKWNTLPEGRLANYVFCASSQQDVLWNAKTTIHQSEQRAQIIKTSIGLGGGLAESA